MTVEIIPFEELTPAQRAAAAEILTRAFAHMETDWGDPANANEEVAEIFDPAEKRTAFAAIENGALIGWIGAIRHHAKTWELHPLAVDPVHQRKGIGGKLARHLEDFAIGEGVQTIWLGTDDDFGGTNIFGVDLYPDVLEKIATLKVATHHPFAFYQKQGYTVTGVLPDASGFGKPDIFMAKRLKRPPRVT